MNIREGTVRECKLKSARGIAQQVGAAPSDAVQQHGVAGTMHDVGKEIPAPSAGDVQRHRNFRDLGDVHIQQPDIAHANAAVIRNRGVDRPRFYDCGRANWVGKKA